MKLKRGFTLVEIIISSGIIALVATISIVSFNVIKKKTKENTLENMSDEILTAVNLYVETNTDIKNELYNNKNGVKIPLTTLENSGLVDFKELSDDLDEEDFVVTMLGSSDPNDDVCASTYTVKPWNITSGEIIYICEKDNKELLDKIDNLQSQINELKNGDNSSDVKNSLKVNSLYDDLTYTAKGANPNNWVKFPVISDDSKFAYFPNDADKDLWRIVTIDTDDKIKLIYPKQVKSNNNMNYTTSSLTYNSNTYYKLKNLPGSSLGDSYYRYSSATGFYGTEISSDVIEGSKKEALYNAIESKEWIITSKYYNSYTMSDSKVISFNRSSSRQLKIGMINPDEIAAATILSENWLTSYAQLVANLYKCIGFDCAELNIYLQSGNMKYNVAKTEVHCDRLNCYYTINTLGYYPVIVLNENVQLVKPNCPEGVELGSKECPYELKCENC